MSLLKRWFSDVARDYITKLGALPGEMSNVKWVTFWLLGGQTSWRWGVYLGVVWCEFSAFIN